MDAKISNAAEATVPTMPGALAAAVVALEAENGRRRGEVARRGSTVENLGARVDALAARFSGPDEPGVVTRRRVIQWGVAATGAGLAGGVARPSRPATPNAGPEPGGPSAVLLASGRSALATGAPETVYAPPPSGNAMTDTANLLTALNVKSGTTVVLQASASAVYLVNQELPVPKGVRVTGLGASGSSGRGLMATLRQAAGVNLHCILGAHGYLAGLYGPPGSGANAGLYQNATTWQQYNNGKTVVSGETAIEIDHIAFDGQNGGAGAGNTQGHGVVLYNTGAVVHDCLFVDIANAAVVVADLNWKGTVCQDEHFENRVTDNAIVNSGWWGIWVTNSPKSPGNTDGYMVNNSVLSPSKQQSSSGPNLSTKAPYEGFRLDNAAGWWVVNNRASLCPGNGFFFNSSWGLHLIGNRADAFGCYPQSIKATYTGFNIECAGAVKTHPGFINENVASAYEGINPIGPPATHLTTFQYFTLTMQPAAPANTALQNISAWVEQANNAASQLSQSAQPIAGATLVKGSKVVTFPHGALAGMVQPGMAVADITTGHSGYVASGTVVTNVTPGAGSAPDSIGLSNAAAHNAPSDTLSFPGPAASVGWTYINNVLVKVNGDNVPSVLNVHRTNETITGTINAVPNIPPTNAATVIITDPANSTAGMVTAAPGGPAPGQVLALTGAATLDWVSPDPGPPSGAAGAILAGRYPAPVWAPLRITRFTANGTYPIPGAATRLRVTCIGGGGGGGGGGAASTAAAQVGGAGAAAGTTAERIVAVGSETVLVVTIGAGGSGGPGAPAGGGVDGGNGTAGGDTVVSGTTISVSGGGGQGGQGAPSNSGPPVSGPAYGSSSGATTANAGSGCGGSSALAGGLPTDFSPGGGGGGGSSTGLKGGTGGGMGTPTGAGTPGSPGASATTSGGPGSPGSSPGAPGGGGGGGTANTGTGGAGGDGSPGFVIIEVVG